MFFDQKNSPDDDFWNLDEFAPKRKRATSSEIKQFSKQATSAVEIEVSDEPPSQNKPFTDSRITSPTRPPQDSAEENGRITRFIPPHSDAAFAKKYTIKEYIPQNPLIKSVKVCSEKADDQIFVGSNLFIRERRALLNRKASECSHVSFYSYSPRYSQMSRAQLNWYLWWRENTRRGIFLKTDESYLILYAYELAATGEDEDKQASLNMLCSLLNEYSEKDISVVFRMMIRDLICDFCLLHGLSSPINLLHGLDKGLLTNAFLPEFFLDFSEERREYTVGLGLSSLSMYDYRRSKLYTPENAESFNQAINAALAAMMADSKAFEAITSFTSGMYGRVTAERRPFARMINIVNRNVKFEITYYQLSNVQAAITDAVRYAENKLREHWGIKNKLHIMSINPLVKDALDRFFAEHYPAMPVIDRRRRNSNEKESETHEYDRLYDVPKTEISPERAIEIERDSWGTTKILTEAFADEIPAEEADATVNAPQLLIEPIIQATPKQVSDVTASARTDNNGIYGQIKEVLGDVADFIILCKNAPSTEQRKFASAHALSLDEIADRVNEAAADVFGDIILEDVGGVYRILEDYMDQF